MTVLLLANLIPDKTGAFEQFVAALGTAMRERNHRLVAAFAGPTTPSVAAILAEAGVTVERIPGWSETTGRVRPWIMLPPAWRLIRRLRPKTVAVHFGNELPTALLALACRFSGVADIHWVWHQRQQIRAPRYWLTRHGSRIRLLALAGFQYVALYRGGLDSLCARGIPSSRITVIPNGVPAVSGMPHVVGRLRELAAAGPSTPCAVNVSSLIPRKRVDLTIAAFAEAVRALRAVGHPAAVARLVLIGEGYLVTDLRAAVKHAGIAEAVCFAGRRDDVRELLAGADVLLLGSDAEACPWVLLEAMAAGVPAIATDAGAAAELIEMGATGWVVPRNDAAAMAAHLKDLLADTHLRKRMGRAARTRWAAGYTEHDMIRRHMMCYIGRMEGGG